MIVAGVPAHRIKMAEKLTLRIPPASATYGRRKDPRDPVEARRVTLRTQLRGKLKSLPRSDPAAVGAGNYRSEPERLFDTEFWSLIGPEQARVLRSLVDDGLFL